MKPNLQKFQEIWNTIGYKSDVYEIILDGLQEQIIKKGIGIMAKGNRDEREIIFNPEFRDKFIEYGLESGDYDGYETYRDIWKYLEDPTDYIYNLLELGNH